jgi:hypothetical protein
MRSAQSQPSASAVSPMTACRSVCLLLSLSVGCALQPPSLPSTPTDLAGIGPARPSSVIARSELSTVKGTTIGDAVRRLRPQFLEASLQQLALRGQRIYPAVFVGNRPFAGIESLDAIPLAAIDEVRFLTPSEARSVYGIGCACAAGVIVLHVRSGEAPLGERPRG